MRNRGRTPYYTKRLYITTLVRFGDRKDLPGRVAARDSGCVNLAAAVKIARADADMTQSALAEAAGISRATLAQIETAKRGCPQRTFKAIQAALPDAAWPLTRVRPNRHGTGVVLASPIGIN